MLWNRLEPTIISKVDYRHVVVKTFQVPDSGTATRATYNLENTRCAGVIAVTDDRKVIVARQFRPGPEQVMDEIPGGGVDEGEDPEVAARRELREETGYVPKKMELLGEFPKDAYMNGKWSYYLATGCYRAGDQELDHHEIVDVHLVPINEFIESARHGKMTDPAAVLAAYDKLKRLEKEG